MNTCHILKKKLVNDDINKMSKLDIKSTVPLFGKNTVIYDFECATNGSLGHQPYFNKMIKLYKDQIDDEKTPCHYINSLDVAKDTFEYIMNIIIKQCDMYKLGKETDNKKLKNEFKDSLYLCGFNNANYDLYFFIRELLKSKYSERFISKTIFKGNTLIFFMLVDKESGKVALRSHDICQILMSSLDKATQSFLNKKCKGIFPHKLINKVFFNDPNILTKTLKLTKDDFYKSKDIEGNDDLDERLKDINMNEYNIKDHLYEYAENDTKITVELYRALNEISMKYYKCDVLRFLTIGQMCHYGFLLNLPEELLYKKYNEQKNKKQQLQINYFYVI